jgi:hypothetical protein
VSRRPQEALRKLRPDDFPGAVAVQPNRAVALTIGVAETVERDAALPAEVECRIRAVLEDRDRVTAGRSDLVVSPAQLSEVLSTKWSPKMASEGHDERSLSPAVRQRYLALAGLDVEVRKLVAFFEHDPGASL